MLTLRHTDALPTNLDIKHSRGSVSGLIGEEYLRHVGSALTIFLPAKH